MNRGPSFVRGALGSSERRPRAQGSFAIAVLTPRSREPKARVPLRRLSGAALLAICAAVAGCGGSSHDNLPTFPGNGGSSALGSGGSSIGLSAGAGNSSNASGGNTSTSVCGDVDLMGCVGQSFEPEAIPLDIYIMFDQSGSMATDVGGLTRLQAVQNAAAAFLNDPKSANIGVGIGYFGFLPIGQVSCDPSVYASADVGVTLDHSRVIASLDARKPTGETPTAAAIDGACNYARTWEQQNPGHRLVILLMTDGIPEAPASCAMGGCCPRLSDAVQAASNCASGNQGIQTYVLGVGPELDNLNQIAAAGGTNMAYLVGNQDVATNVLNALNTIRGAAIPCDLAIPTPSAGQTLDFTQVNVLYAAGGCDFNAVYYVSSESACDPSAGGWYYDDPSAPTTVKLCPSTCTQVSRPDASLRFSIGCGSIPPPPR